MQERMDIELLVRVARLYYEAKLSQNEIAKKINVSRPTVSRMLKQAEENGYVKKIVIDPFEAIQSMCNELRTAFNLKEVIIVQTMDGDARAGKEQVAVAAANYLDNLIKPNDIVGVTWGTTMYEVAKALHQSERKGISVVQLNGFLYHSSTSNYVFDVIHSFGTKLQSEVRYLFAPAICSTAKLKEAFLSDPNISETLRMGKQSNIAIYSLGLLEKTSMILQNGYLQSDEYAHLYEANVAGDICSRFINSEGHIIAPELNQRTIGLQLEDLRQKEYSICVIAGKSRAAGALGALRARYANVLITDRPTAKEILLLMRKGV